MNATLLGGLTLGVPLLLLGVYFLWRRWRTVFWMYFGALILGLGYLAATGALADIGSWGDGIVYESEAPASAPADASGDTAPAAPAPSDPAPATP